MICGSNTTYSSGFRDTVFSKFGLNYTLECVDSYGDTSSLHSNLTYNDDRSRTIDVVNVDGVSNTIGNAHACKHL